MTIDRLVLLNKDMDLSHAPSTAYTEAQRTRIEDT